jgi:hypothetical protein
MFKKNLFILLFTCVFCTIFAGSFNSSTGYVMGHITTCTGLINDYPADSTNWFYRKNHSVVQYWVYMLFPAGPVSGASVLKPHHFVNPYNFYSGTGVFKSENNYTFENKWVSPSGKILCEKIVTWDKKSANKRVNVGGVECVPYVFANYAGISMPAKENGQTALPDEKGLYHVELYVNGELAAVTFFEMKD